MQGGTFERVKPRKFGYDVSVRVSERWERGAGWGFSNAIFSWQEIAPASAFVLSETTVPENRSFFIKEKKTHFYCYVNKR